MSNNPEKICENCGHWDGNSRLADALCFGWSEIPAKMYDDTCEKFTPITKLNGGGDDKKD